MKPQVILATGNPGKLREYRSLLRGLPLEVVPQSQYDVAQLEETGQTFIENALLKARHAAEITHRAAIADDSGIEVAALNGAPGIYSARFAGPNSTDADNNNKLLMRMDGLEGAHRRANFRCVIVYLRHSGDPAPVIAEGVWQGLILTAPRGVGGFGYDPVFFDPDKAATGAEIDPVEKNRISHRGRAAAELRLRLVEREGWVDSG